MKTETETLIRNVIALDPEIAADDIEKALNILRGKNEANTEVELVQVLRYKDVIALLKIHRRTLEYYIEQGYLDRVYGRGERALGISRDSFIRFTTQRTLVHNKPAKKREKISATQERTPRRAITSHLQRKGNKHI